jgi:hypothetical protein
MSMGRTLLHSADIEAWLRRHVEVRVEHVVAALLVLVELRHALDKRGLHPEDALAVTEQLLHEVPVRSAHAPDEQPPRSTGLHAIVCEVSTATEISSARLVTGVATALPRELAFLRAPLTAAAAEVGVLYDRPSACLDALGRPSATQDGALTLENWDPELRRLFVAMQSLVDTSWGTWELSPKTLLMTVLFAKSYQGRFRAAGVDPEALVDEIPGVGDETVRKRPSAQAGMGARLFALVLRAEADAARAGAPVGLEHVLRALHDEANLARVVERLLV